MVDDTKHNLMKDMFSLNSNRCIIPLSFWFNENTSLALPIIAHKYHDAEISITLSSLDDIKNTNITAQNNITMVELLVEEIYLTQIERNKFSTFPMEYVIQQHQHQHVIITEELNSIELQFVHPCKEIIWFFLPK